MNVDTDDNHQIRPGDKLIFSAFEGITQVYNQKLKLQWENDVQEFINHYTKHKFGTYKDEAKN